MIRRRRILIVYLVGRSVLVTQGQTVKTEVTLRIGGAAVRLGMSQSDVMSEMRHAGMKPTPLGSRMFIVSGGTMQFTQGRLSFADREWNGNGESEMDAVIGALGTLAGRGGTQCVVQNAPISEPEHKAERIFVTCGARSILLMVGTDNGERVGAVSERIGHFDPSR